MSKSASSSTETLLEPSKRRSCTGTKAWIQVPARPHKLHISPREPTHNLLWDVLVGSLVVPHHIVDSAIRKPKVWLRARYRLVHSTVSVRAAISPMAVLSEDILEEICNPTHIRRSAMLTAVGPYQCSLSPERSTGGSDAGRSWNPNDRL